MGPINEVILLLKDYKDKVSIIENNGENVVKAISSADVVVATRFHAMVLGALFEKTVVANIGTFSLSLSFL